MLKAYVSGPITGLIESVYLANFKKAEILLKEMGYYPVNPCEIDTKDCKSWEDYMVCDIKELFKCQAIYMLKNWRTSKGARIERAIALEMGMFVFYEEEAIKC